MQPNGMRGAEVMPRNWLAPREAPLLARFLGKLVLDVLPAALASVIGGILFTQYQFGHVGPPRHAAQQVAPASAEMLALVRDEHAMIIDYLKSQMAAQKSRLAAQDQDAARAAAEPVLAEAEVAAEPPARRNAAVPVALKPAATRSKSPAASVPVPVPAPHPPLLIAQADQNAAAPTDRLAHDPDSLLAKTLDFKDNVVAATRHAVSVIGDVFNSVGERLGGGNPDAGSAGRQQFSSAS
jgi:hypothetical protein